MKINGGYYIKARKIQESKIQRKPPYVREIWDWLLMNANHSDNKYNGFTIKRGQLFRTYRDIREGLSWQIGYRKEMYSDNQTKKAMKSLRDALMIDTVKELGGVMITILNYSEYQDPKNYESTNDGTSERTNEEPMKNQGGPSNNKNEKNGKNEKKINIHTHFENLDSDDLSESDPLIAGDRTPGQDSATEEQLNLPSKQDKKKKKKASHHGGNGVPYQKIEDSYHEILTKLPKILDMTDDRKAGIRVLWNMSKGPSSAAKWLDYFNTITEPENSFLMGDNDRGWRANIDFLIKKKSYVKIMEGQYKGLGMSGGKSGTVGEVEENNDKALKKWREQHEKS